MILNHTCHIPGVDAELFVEFEYTLHRKAKISGPAEKCYPEEGGEVELIEVNLLSDEEGHNLLEILSEKTLIFIEDKMQTWALECQASGEL